MNDKIDMTASKDTPLYQTTLRELLMIYGKEGLKPK